MVSSKPVVLMILDGWGHGEPSDTNAVHCANTPHMDRLAHDYPSGFINASELHVGLPSGQMGNSEVGHMNIGSGRVIQQELVKIDSAVEHNQLASLLPKDTAGKDWHIMGLLSPGGVHSHQAHIEALAKRFVEEGYTV